MSRLAINEFHNDAAFRIQKSQTSIKGTCHFTHKMSTYLVQGLQHLCWNISRQFHNSSCRWCVLDPVVQDLFILPPLSTTFTETDLEMLGALFPDIVRRWQSIMDEKLLNMIAPSQKNTESLFQLASTNFSCLGISSNSYTLLCHCEL